MRFYALLALLALAAGTPALAQTTSQSAPAAGSSEIPKHNCTKPGPFPGEATSTDRQLLEFGKEYKAYTDCLRKFALDQQKIAEPHMKAANAAADEYNAAVKAYNEEMERRKK